MNKFGLATLTLLLVAGQSAHATDGIKWYTSMVSASKVAKKTNRPIVIDFYADWCGWCKVLDKKTYTDKRVIALMSKAVAVKLNVDTKEGRQVAQYLGVSPLPTIGVYDAKGNFVGLVTGYRPPREFEAIITQMISGKSL